MSDSKPRNIVITVNRPSAVFLPGPSKDASYKVTPDIATGQMLLPGENDVNSAYWDDVKGNGTVKMYLACKILANRGVGKAQEIVDGLDEMTVSAASKFIKECTDVPQLMDWKAKSEKAGIQKAIDSRIAVLIDEADGEAK